MNANNKRVEWIDVAKAVAIILVGVGHYSCPQWLLVWIYAFHMPLFFILSGYTFKTEKYNFVQFVIRKIKTLILPWCIAVIFYVLFQNVCIYMKISGIEIPFSHMIPRIIIHTRKELFDPVYWFIPCLFVSEIVLYVLIKNIKCKNNTIIIGGVSLAMAWVYKTFIGTILPWEIDLIPITMFYLCVGRQGTKIMKKISSIGNIKILLGIAALSIGTVFCWLNWRLSGEKLTIVSGTYGIFLLAILASVLCSLGIIIMCQFIRCNLLKYIGQNSLMFYLLQPFMYKIADIALCICIPTYTYAGNMWDLIALHVGANILILAYIWFYVNVKSKIMHKTVI